MGFGVAVWAIYVVGRAVGATLRGESSRSDVRGLLGAAAILPIVVVAMFGVLLVHELGHLVGGQLGGLRPFLLVIGPFRMERERARWRIRWNRDLALAGGLAACLPSGPMDPVRLRRATVLSVAGGPLASLVLGAGLFLLWRGLFEGQPGLAPKLPIAIAVASLAIAGITLVPGRTAGFLTDGARLWLLWKGGPTADRDVAIQALFGASLGGVRPRDWSVDLLERAQAVPDDSPLTVVAWQLAQMHAADSGDHTRAKQLLDRVLAHIDRLPPAAHRSVRLDAARQIAIWGDVERARSFLAEPGEALGAPFLRPCAEVALLVAAGQHREASAALPAARRALAESSDPGGAAWLASDLDLLAERIAAAGRS